MEVNAEELIATLKNKITLYEHLGIEVLEINSEKVRFRVSLEKNKNHKGTAFGGSQYATAVMAAYALVLAGLHARQIPTENIVIAKGDIQYLRPVESDFEIICAFPSREEENAFYDELVKNKKVKGTLKSQIVADGGSLKAVLTGVFVVKL
ncbi:YiiD C-terminal domain-containing protein [Bdellovibrio sp. 22V]|uniref:YiiD C-terminal domain-containing protein n=1 Tax=Bdellovibrio TaxID=958 RepID=UPI002542FE78|nr:YiiD C-terminal domain-containing protein [Bdellovibrio sp. 22V]WII71678.1 YiiD C-terminal domain-containing protein [Bdellovibrio sp. 22V]